MNYKNPVALIYNGNVPEEIKKKLGATLAEVDKLIEEANSIQGASFSGKFSLKYHHSAPGDILTPTERAQSVCFVSRYEHLPVLTGLEIIEREGGFHLKQIAFLRHILNEYRSIVENKKDSVHYLKVHAFCDEKLRNRDPSKGLSITVVNEQLKDITETFLQTLIEKIKSIELILTKAEFGYIYNGILQHSDYRYTERFWEEYSMGKLNYVFIKHAALCGYIKDCLHSHYLILNQLTFPKMGSL